MTEMMLVVVLGGRRAALPALAVSAVVELGSVTLVPRAEPHIVVLAALRSRPLTVIDCSASLGLGSAADWRARRAVVVEHHEAGARRPLVNSTNEIGHAKTLVRLVGGHPAYGKSSGHDTLIGTGPAQRVVATRRADEQLAHSLGAGSWSSGRPGCSPPRASR